MPTNFEKQSSLKPSWFSDTYLGIVFAIGYTVLVYDQFVGLNWLIVSLVVQTFLHVRVGRFSEQKGYYAASQIFTTLIALSIALYGFEAAPVLLYLSWLLVRYYAGPKKPFVLPFALLWAQVDALENFFQPIQRGDKKGFPLGQYLLGGAVVLVFYSLYVMASPGFQALNKTLLDSVSFLLVIVAGIGIYLFKGLLLRREPLGFAQRLSPMALGWEKLGEGLRAQGGVLVAVLLAISAMGAVAVVSDWFYTVEATSWQQACANVYDKIAKMLVSVVLALFLVIVVSLIAPAEEAARKQVNRAMFLFLAVNVGFLANSIWANAHYVHLMGLTHLRIALFIWLGVVASGLGLTALFIARQQSLGWLINANGWVVYGVISLFLVGPWDFLIAKDQLRRVDSPYFDRGYLASLDVYALPVLDEQSATWLSSDTWAQDNHRRKVEAFLKRQTQRTDPRGWVLTHKWAAKALEDRK